MTAAYAFTDYCGQSQTIPYVLVYVATPPTGSLSLFNLYIDYVPKFRKSDNPAPTRLRRRAFHGVT